MTQYVNVVIVVLAWQLVRSRLGAAPWPALGLRAPWTVPACAAGSLLLFLVQLWTLAFESRHQIAPSCFYQLPIGVVADFGPKTGGAAMPLPGAILMTCAILQVALLSCLYAASEGRSPTAPERRVTIVVIALAIVAAIFAPAMTSTDPYLYFSYAKVGFGSFAAAPHRVAIPDFPLNRWWCGNDLLLPSAYGPAFVAYARALIGGIHSVTTAILVLRISGAFWLLACLAALRRLGCSSSILSVAALNPAILFQYVANAHNDLIPITLVVGALAVASTPVRLCAVVIAGLVKLPFLIIGALAFFSERSRLRRFVLTALGIAFGFGISYLWAGKAYFEGLAWYRHLLALSGDPHEIVLTAAAIAFLGLALARGIFSPAGAFAFPGLTIAEIQPWYVLWGLPYAALEKQHLAFFLASLPVAAYLMDDSTPPTLQRALFFAIALAVIVLAVRDFSTKKLREVQSGG